MKLDPEETILLTKQDYDRMLAACKQPPNPSDALIRAAERYKERTNNG